MPQTSDTAMVTLTLTNTVRHFPSPTGAAVALLSALFGRNLSQVSCFGNNNPVGNQPTSLLKNPSPRRGLMVHFFYRWFVGLSPDAPVLDPTTFTKNGDRLQNGDVFAKFMAKLLNHSEVKPLLSDEHPDPHCPQGSAHPRLARNRPVIITVPRY
jgi:hypothetical protein